MWWKILLMILVLTALFFVLGMYAGGAVYLWMTGGDIHQVSFNTLLSVGDISISNRQKIFLPWAWCVTAALTFLPTGLTLLILFGGMNKQKNLHGNAHFATDRELKAFEYKGNYK